jgi:hypothetical protein
LSILHDSSRRTLGDALPIVGNGVSLALRAGRDVDKEIAKTEVCESGGCRKAESVVDEGSRKEEPSTADDEATETIYVVGIGRSGGEDGGRELTERCE